MDDLKRDIVCGYGIDIVKTESETDTETCNKIWKILEQNGIEVLGCEPLDTWWTLEEYENG